ncbi:MAG: hypothetical protein P4L79_18525 [Legionella sp.]|uniref:hypothetical protein n=1 Tax=Legionella sp. TaxID=459 RepID=UPI00283C587B|nr:hypothetical protein [Legionella sp.]
MKVQRISEHINELRKEKIQAECDAVLFDKMSTYFLSKSSEALLDERDVTFLMECFVTRWGDVHGKDHDYTLSNSPIELKWISLAKELGKYADVPYLKILMNTIGNDHDPHDGSALTQTETMTNFYLANHGTVLCRKRSLCDYLLDHELKLATSRSLDATVIFTLDELSSLKRCKVNSFFSIETKIEESQAQTNEKQTVTEYFTSFWDFLQRKVFANSSHDAEFPIGFLNPLFDLVECYIRLKGEGKEFSLFQKEASKFFEYVYNSALLNVNSLYGQRVFYKGREHYLLDVLIAIFDATQFNLEQEILAITRLLCSIEPELETKNSVLRAFYLDEQKKLVYTPENEVEAYINCCRLLVSLFVTKFELGFFIYKGQEIVAWDQENEIPYEFYGVYTKLLEVFNSEKPNYIDAYYNVIKNEIASLVRDNAHWARKIRTATSRDWLKKAHISSLSEIGGHWYPPELIIHRLLKFIQTDTTFKKQITDFLDEFVTTYAQEQGDFRKELRVNILCSQFFSKLSEQQCHTVVTFMTSGDDVSADGIESDFLNNCIVHINNRLVELGYHQPIEKSPGFFPVQPRYEIDPSLVLGRKHLIEVIEQYATKLELGHLDDEVQGKIRRFLFDLKNPILSCADRNESIKESETRVDPIGQPS